MNLALHSHASLLQDRFCENSTLLVIISHSSEQAQYIFFLNNNAIRETKVGCILLFPFANREGEIDCSSPIQKGLICGHLCGQVLFL